MADEHLRHAHADGGMSVVPTGVHDAGRLRPVGDVVFRRWAARPYRSAAAPWGAGGRSSPSTTATTPVLPTPALTSCRGCADGQHDAAVRTSSKPSSGCMWSRDARQPGQGHVLRFCGEAFQVIHVAASFGCGWLLDSFQRFVEQFVAGAHSLIVAAGAHQDAADLLDALAQVGFVGAGFPGLAQQIFE